MQILPRAEHCKRWGTVSEQELFDIMPDQTLLGHNPNS